MVCVGLGLFSQVVPGNGAAGGKWLGAAVHDGCSLGVFYGMFFSTHKVTDVPSPDLGLCFVSDHSRFPFLGLDERPSVQAQLSPVLGTLEGWGVQPAVTPRLSRRSIQPQAWGQALSGVGDCPPAPALCDSM